MQGLVAMDSFSESDNKNTEENTKEDTVSALRLKIFFTHYLRVFLSRKFIFITKIKKKKNNNNVENFLLQKIFILFYKNI